MKTVRGYSVIFSILVLIPLMLIKLNKYFNLPEYQNNILLGSVLIVVGISIILHCLGLFIKKGKGVPVPTEQPQFLVMGGLYKFTRNPMYLAVFIILLGELLLTGYFLQFIYLLTSIFGFYFNVIFREEPNLEKKFGEKYKKYTKDVPRWLPKLKS